MSETSETRRKSGQRIEEKIFLYLIVIAVALVAGYYLTKALIPTPKIGVIRLETQVSGLLADAMAREINFVRHSRDIKAVVLVINSPGGSASAGHDIYYQVRKLREEKPVVASMDLLAASAAYQIGVGANEIYAKPASIIGNVGVIMGQPSPEVLSEQYLTTGPFKATGGSSTSFVQMLDLLHADFRDSVVAERSKAPNPLQLSPEEVATGEIWIGIEAEAYGLIDHLGSILDATERAAELANIKNYQVVDVRQEYINSLEEAQAAAALSLYEEIESLPEIDLSTEEREWPAFYQLYIPLE